MPPVIVGTEVRPWMLKDGSGCWKRSIVSRVFCSLADLVILLNLEFLSLASTILALKSYYYNFERTIISKFHNQTNYLKI